MPDPHRPVRFRFGHFELLPAERRLLGEGTAVPLGNRAFDLLVALAIADGKLVSKDELIERVWPGLVVEDGNLQVQVSALRKALGTEAIATVAGHGYRLVPSVRVLAGGAPPRHNLPRHITSFVGREEQLAQQRERLATTRLLTVTGSGGLGKSRFSLQLASAVLDEYEDGVWLIELAAVADSANVAASFAAVLGVSDAHGISLREAVVGFVRDRHLLLVLDNCEHVIAPVAELATALLAVSPLVKLIATSREPLHVFGEVLCPLAPLRVPADRDIPVQLARESPAVRLFEARAAAAQPGFELTAANLPAVMSICTRLDGIPLALELAAARMRTSSVQTIAQRLDDTIGLLTSGDRTALPRHQTLRAAIDWSYDYLSPGERALMGRLSVFAGGFELDAASALHGDDALDLVERLVDKSLLVVDPERARYSLLEPLRQYARDRLVEAGDEASARDAHLAWFLGVAEAAEPKLLGPEQAGAYAQLARERDNLLAAHARCAYARDGAILGLRLVCALRMFWHLQGPLHVGYRLANEALAQAGSGARDYWHCQALFSAGTLAYFLGRHGEARELCHACEEIARELRDRDKISDVLALLASLSLAEGDTGTARTHVAESLALARESGDGIRISQALTFDGEVRAQEGDDEGAIAAYEESLDVIRSVGEQATLAGILVNIARSAMVLDRHDVALRRMTEARDVLATIQTRHQTCAFLAMLAAIMADQQAWRRAATAYGAFEACAKIQGFDLERVDRAVVAPRIEATRAALGEAAFEEAKREGWSWPDPWSLAAPREWLAEAR